MYLSLIIPAYNEAERIGASLGRALDYLAAQPYDYEVLVIDDGSRDATADVVHRFTGDCLQLLRQPHNMGKGAAVRRGMLAAAGEHRIFSDADFSTPITELPRMLEQMREYDVVIGSRAIDASYIKEHQPWYRESMGIIFNRLVQILAVPGIQDTQCGFKGFHARAADDIFGRTKIDGFSFDVEALFLARSLGYTIKEMPVEWRNDARSTLNPISDSLKMFQELIKIRSLHRNL